MAPMIEAAPGPRGGWIARNWRPLLRIAIFAGGLFMLRDLRHFPSAVVMVAGAIGAASAELLSVRWSRGARWLEYGCMTISLVALVYFFAHDLRS